MTDFRPSIVRGYEVSSDGRVFSISSNWRGYGRREMTQFSNQYGYRLVNLTVNGNTKKYRVHRLVCFAFCGNPPTEKHEVRHLDGTRDNNNSSNLVWGTKSENALDRGKHGTQYIPEWHKPEFREKALAGMRKYHDSK